MNASEIIVVAVLAALAGLLGWRVCARLRSLQRILVIAARTGRLSRLGMPLAIAALATAGLVVPVEANERSQALHTVLIVLLGLGLTWFVAGALVTIVTTALATYDVSAADNLVARRIHTQYGVLLRIGTIVVWTIGAAVVLSSFPAVRTLGAGILASAGIVGLVVGLAAQRTIGNFLAGIQIALAQPVRLDDAVVIDGEWGWIEEITTTFVVVKIWDERRLIVPFSRLLEQSFQNWTRTRADLLASVMLWADYRVPVAALRQELIRVVGESELWDGRVAVLQVVETNERAVQLRALVSASSSPKAWDLRCFVREKLITFLAHEHPSALPAIRAEVETAARAREQAPPPVPPSVHAHMVEPQAGGLPGEPEPQVEVQEAIS